MGWQRSRRRAATALAVVAVAAGGTLAAAGSASAATAAYGPSYIGSNSGGANLRTCGSVNCGWIAYMPNGTSVTMLCWADTEWVNPPYSDYSSPRWFRLATAYGIGWTHSALVENQTSVPHC